MASRRRSGGGGPSRLAWLGLLLLAVPGFAVGLLAGIAWRDPGLLARHLLGASEEVALAGPEAPAPEAEAAPAGLPDVAAPSPTPRSATRMRPEVLSPGARSGRFAVQVGAFAESPSAERLADALRRKGFDVYVSAGTAAGEQRWRVRVGPLPSREEAERTAKRLKAEEKLPTWVLDEDGSV